MSATLSNQAQLRYVLQWFQEWSEMQRGDFLGILIEKCGPGGLVNGLVSSLESLVCKDDSNKPPSLFECRVKLFREWSHNWSMIEKDTLLSSIKNLDPKFAEKYDQRLTKGDENNEEEEEEEQQEQQQQQQKEEKEKEEDEDKEKEEEKDKEKQDETERIENE